MVREVARGVHFAITHDLNDVKQAVAAPYTGLFATACHRLRRLRAHQGVVAHGHSFHVDQ